MQITIYCSFDGVDFADLAAGKINSMESGIHEIEYGTPKTFSGTQTEPDVPDSIPSAVIGSGFNGGVYLPLAAEIAGLQHSSPYESTEEKAMLKITCEENVSKMVINQLVSLGAEKITVQK